MIKMDHIFLSIQGEGNDTGKPCVFVRTFGCNLKCSYCDQPQNKYAKMSVANIVSEVRKLALNTCAHTVCITGGEPMLQNDVYTLADILADKGFDVSIETNGAIPLENIPNRKYHYVMDFKTPSSECDQANVYDNVYALTKGDQIKFVVADRTDFEFAKKICNKTLLGELNRGVTILFSPVIKDSIKDTIGADLCTWVTKEILCKNVRIQVQLHKVLGVE